MKKIVLMLVAAMVSVGSFAHANEPNLSENVLQRTGAYMQIIDCSKVEAKITPEYFSQWKVAVSKLTSDQELAANKVINSKKTCAEVLTAMEVTIALTESVK